MAPTLLHISDLSIDFAAADGQLTHALENISISVKKGELLALVGESGSGKSVTALSVLQLLPAPPAVFCSGQIVLHTNGEKWDLLKMPARELPAVRGNKVAMIFQEPMTSLNPVLTCGFQVLETIRQHKPVTYAEAREKTLALFEKVNLPDPPLIFKRYPHQLSGGQKQRVMIAMAMSCEPHLLICDEPTTTLDVTVQRNILSLIRELQLQNNMGVLFITHDLGVVAEIADRVVVLYKGKIVEENTTHELFTAPQHPYTKALLACRPILYKKGQRLPVVGEEPPVVTAVPPIIQTFTVPLLTVENLKVWYPNQKTWLGKVTGYTKAVDGVTFTAYAGETLGLVGESGCGKSTLGRAVLRLIEATSGEINYKNMDLRKADAAQLNALRKDMQIIFQDPYSSLNPRMSIGEAIAEPLGVRHCYRTATA